MCTLNPRVRILLWTLGPLFALSACNSRSVVESHTVQVLSVRPHDPDAFTQGLLLQNGMLYESTGRYGESSLRKVDPETGAVLQKVLLPHAYFGEGLALWENRLVQLTWREEVAFVYALADFEPLGQFSYQGQAWGLCFDGTHFVMSDGTATLSLRDPGTFEVIDRISVTSKGEPVRSLNELECVGGSVYANVYRTDTIVRIDKATGRVTAIIDASGLLTAVERLSADVLNGIAHNPESGSFLITGKLWPKLFEVRFGP